MGREDREELGLRFQPQVPRPRLGRLGTFVSSRSSLLSETQTFPGSPRLSPEVLSARPGHVLVAGRRYRAARRASLCPLPASRRSRPLDSRDGPEGRGRWVTVVFTLFSVALAIFFKSDL